MTSASEIEKRFRNKPELFTLKKHEATKSDAWKYFSLLFKKQGADSDSLTCCMSVCLQVYITNYKLKAQRCLYICCLLPSQ